MTIMDANNSYAFTANRPIKSPFKWNDYGYEIDGPVRIPKLFNGRNKLFFMSNFETLVQRQSSASRLLRADGRHAARQLQRLADHHLRSDHGGSPIPGNIIPASQLNPTSQHC